MDAQQLLRDPGAGQHVTQMPRKVLVASAIGTVIEFYDFFIYSTAAALVFDKLFFPSSVPLVGVLGAFTVYAIGYVARPIGGILFGHFGDRIGRRSMLVLSMLLMGLGTLCVGFMPTYAQIGVWSPILLVVLRLLQAIGFGGEWGGAVLMVAETAPSSRRGLYGSIVQLGNPIGRLVATVAFTFAAKIPNDAFISWGWRLPFLASSVLVIVGLIIRFQISETPAFTEMLTKNKRSKTPLVDLFRNGKRTVAISIGLKVTEVAWVGVMTVFAVFYLTRKMGIDRGTVLTAITIATFLEIFVIPVSGWLSDRIGRRVIYLFGTVFGICFAFPMFWLFDTRDPTIITLTMIAGICIGQGVMFALHASFLPELFATQVRYTGISLGFQVGSAIGGGLTPLFSAMAVSWDGGATWPVSVVLVCLGVLTLIATIASRSSSEQTI